MHVAVRAPAAPERDQDRWSLEIFRVKIKGLVGNGKYGKGRRTVAGFERCGFLGTRGQCREDVLRAPVGAGGDRSSHQQNDDGAVNDVAANKYFDYS